MSNRHIKIINGRRYYYESIRRGKKVTSRYLGPVDERKRKPRKVNIQQTEEIKQESQPEKPQEEQEYIG
ncbi:MAG: hypothetical protein J4415_01225 [Candidatus Diapherotrites archaeon]|uniref:Uncharacterized protein n=1 Tax=Candidatus Iainarchaeum sp. TaxID=3101447 RepID=A0A8T4KSA2_9ARCH|nr:hypothetical protein [Candidatus Diapherotrites archaeon]HLD38785.1 hypothetical protein [archaeon]